MDYEQANKVLGEPLNLGSKHFLHDSAQQSEQFKQAEMIEIFKRNR